MSEDAKRLMQYVMMSDEPCLLGKQHRQAVNELVAANCIRIVAEEPFHILVETIEG